MTAGCCAPPTTGRCATPWPRRPALPGASGSRSTPFGPDRPRQLRSRRMAVYPIRTFGDPVLRLPCAEVTVFDDTLRKLAEDMLETMYDAPGVGLAANQIGVQKRLFVFDINDGSGPGAIVNPVLSNHRGEWEYTEGCLSVPDLHWPIVRFQTVRVDGFDL